MVPPRLRPGPADVEQLAGVMAFALGVIVGAIVVAPLAAPLAVWLMERNLRRTSG